MRTIQICDQIVDSSYITSDVTNIKLDGQIEPNYLSHPLVVDYGIAHGHICMRIFIQ